MRLVKSEADGSFSLENYLDVVPPFPYAILSHTWGDEEVTFTDVMSHEYKSKAGYHKLRFCSDQAAKDGLQYFWIDTCCIDRSDGRELQEAVNSIFRWYTMAAKCYVYLSDVSATGSDWNKHAFLRSKWFTRAWTVQELIAPSSVEFFSAEGYRLGDKISLLQDIHDITRIPIRAIQGHDLSQFSIEERLSWAKGRSARHEEDLAYSLMGLFDIYMPIIYGEGKDSAFRRLRRAIERSGVEESVGKALISKVATDTVFDGTTFIFVVILFSLLSGVAIGTCVMQSREKVCDPKHDKLRNDDGFWALLSQLFLQVLTVYCTLHPVSHRGVSIKISQLWFTALLIVSFLACVMALALYATSWKAAAVLSFVSNLAAVMSLAQLTSGLSVKTDGGSNKVKV